MASLEALTGFVTAPSTTLTAWTMASGDSLQVKNAPANAFLIGIWAKNQAAGILRVRSARMHDNVQGSRFRVVLGEVHNYLSEGFAQPLVSQDALIVEHSGSAVAGDIETGSVLLYYPSLPGSDGNYISAGILRQRMVNYFTQEVSITAGTAGGYSGSAAINSAFDLMKANTDYALLGIMTSVLQASVTLRGPDTGNLRIAVPGNAANKNVNRSFFVNLANQYGLPLIPVINSANKGATFVETVNDENAASPVVTLVMAELRKA